MSNKPKPIYRKVLHDFDDEVMGVVKIEPAMEMDHWIIDNNGYRRTKYRFRTIDEIEYDEAVVFKMYPKLNVTQPCRLVWLIKSGDNAGQTAILSLLSLSLYCMLFTGYFLYTTRWGDPSMDYHESIIHFGVFSVLCGLIIVGSLWCWLGGVLENVVRKNTQRDKLIEAWTKHLHENVTEENTQIRAEEWWKEQHEEATK